MRFSKALIPVGVCLVVLISTAGHPAGDEPTAESAASAVAAILGALPFGDCPTNCEFYACGGSGHRNLETAGGNDDGEVHSCAHSSNGCADHSCGATETFADLEVLIPHLDAESLRMMQRKYSNFAVNAERGAVQVFGCKDKVALSLNLTEAQKAGLN